MLLVTTWRTILGLFLLVVLSACGAGGPPGGGGTDPDTTEIDTRAAALAGAVVAGVTREVVEEALLAAGFTIRPADGVPVAATASGGMGIALEAFDVDALTLVTAKGTSLPYDDLVAALREGFGDFPDADFDAFILDGIRTAAQSHDPSLRFWGRFIVELGRQGVHEYDLLGEVDTSTVRLSVLQMTLVAYRLLVDTYVAMQPSAATLVTVRPATVNCTPEKIDEIITDLGVAGLTAANGQLLSYWAKQNIAGAAAAGEVIGAAKLVFTYVKLAWTIVAFEGDILMDSYPYLPRTKSTQYWGDTRYFAYTARYRIPDLSYLNCFRIVLAAAGLDFDFDDGKPIEGASALWRILKGGATGATGGYSPGYIQWTQSAGTSVKQETNANGVAYIHVSGKPQPVALPSRVREVHKPGRIGVDVAIESGNILKDITGAIGGSVLTLPAELIMRTRWAFNSALDFTVIDWEKDDSCGGSTAALAASPFATTPSWTGHADFSYDFTFDDGRKRITQTVTGTLDVDLVTDAEPKRTWGSPTGTASIAHHEYSYVSGEQTFSLVGSGPLLPYAPPEGSRVLLNFHPEACTFNVYGLAAIVANRTYGNLAPQSVSVNIAHFASGELPLPSDGVLVGGGAYTAHSAIYIETGPHNATGEKIGAWFSPYASDTLRFAAGEAALGTASVSWRFEPAAAISQPSSGHDSSRASP
jgi:hypothetical protein